MHQRLPALKCHIPDAPPVQDRQRPGKRVGIEVSRGSRERLVPRETAKLACCVADICDGDVTDRRQLKFDILKDRAPKSCLAVDRPIVLLDSPVETYLDDIVGVDPS